MEDITQNFTLAGRFKIASLIILVLGMLGVGIWVQRQIEAGIVRGTAQTTSNYIQNLVGPALQGVDKSRPISSQTLASLERQFSKSMLGEHVEDFRIWGPDGSILYDTKPSNIGRVFPIEESLARAWHGEVSARISYQGTDDPVDNRPMATNLLETYSPIYADRTQQVIAVTELYEQVGELQDGIIQAQASTWAVVAAAMLIMYLLLIGFVQRASNTIVKQKAALGIQVNRLQDLLAQNEELSERVRQAAARKAEITERYLRRISAELHDGPAQELSVALLRYDPAEMVGVVAMGNSAERPATNRNALFIRESMLCALAEIRAISAGLGLPELEHLSPFETASRAVSAHEQRTRTSVSLTTEALPAELPLSIKVAVYRLIQEGLNNAFRYAGGRGQAVHIQTEGNELHLSVSDEGPGFDTTQVVDGNKHLGIAGMRERVQSLGGHFCIESVPGRGTQVVACLPLDSAEDVLDG